MAHYNLYETLQLSRALPPNEIAAELQRRLTAGELTNPGGAEEVQVAIQILGDPDKRTAYDAILDDPSQPELKISGLRQLATGNPNPQPTAGPGYPAGPMPQNPNQFTQQMGQQFGKANEAFKTQTAEMKGEFQRSSKKAIVVTAIATALVVIVVSVLVQSLFGSKDGVDKDAVKAAEKFVKIDDAEEMRDWIDEYTPAAEREDVYESLSVEDMDKFKSQKPSSAWITLRS